jgi:hypothetical protein
MFRICMGKSIKRMSYNILCSVRIAYRYQRKEMKLLIKLKKNVAKEKNT